MSGTVLAAIISTGGALFVGVLTQLVTVWKLRRENRTQHDNVGNTLARVETKLDLTHEGVRDVAQRLDDHINSPHHSNVIVHPRHTTGGNSDVA